MAKRKKKSAAMGEPDLTQEAMDDIEHDWLVDMVGEEDAAYFEAAGIDDIGNK